MVSGSNLCLPLYRPVSLVDSPRIHYIPGESSCSMTSKKFQGTDGHDCSVFADFTDRPPGSRLSLGITGNLFIFLVRERMACSIRVGWRLKTERDGPFRIAFLHHERDFDNGLVSSWADPAPLAATGDLCRAAHNYTYSRTLPQSERLAAF